MSVVGLLLAVVVWRVTRLVTTDRAFRPVRDRVVARWPVTPEDAQTAPGRGGYWRVVPVAERRRVRPSGPGYWIECPWCVAPWVATVLTAVTARFVSVPAPVLVAAAAAAGASLIHALLER